MPSSLPPTIQNSVSVAFNNDVLGRGGSFDDFRTQQLIISAQFSRRWLVTLDHSILTAKDTSSPARIDQLSGSLGYRLIGDASSGIGNTLLVGGGFRSTGEFAGERMQNGAHRLVNSAVEEIPYADVDETDATLWIDAQRFTLLPNESETGWRYGYWLRGRSLVTSDGQWDSSAGAYVVAKRNSIDAWLGLRRDWRSGYDLEVLRETAEAEDDLSLALGVRWGPVVIQTVQQFDNEASFGQIRLISSTFDSSQSVGPDPRFGVEAGVLLPDVQVQLAGRYHTNIGRHSGSQWDRSVLASISYGEPQYRDDPSLYVRSQQLGLGFEVARPLPAERSGASIYGSLGAGLRRERLIGDGDRSGQKSPSEDSAVVLLSVGVRLGASTIGENWDYRLQLGLTAWLPLEDARAELDGETFKVQRSGLALALSASFDVR